jgi:hypothetical protein
MHDFYWVKDTLAFFLLPIRLVYVTVVPVTETVFSKTSLIRSNWARTIGQGSAGPNYDVLLKMYSGKL